LASRLYTNQLQRNAGRTRLSVPLAGENRDPTAALMDVSAQSMSRQSRMALEAFALESRRRIQQNPDAERFRW
jgi:acetyl-CoA acetyltransferase